jgi:hypothetical protein
MKENARLIGILVFFVVLAAVTWKWQQSGSEPSPDEPDTEQVARDSTSDYSSSTSDSPNGQRSDKKATTKKKTTQKPAASKNAGSDYRKVYFPPGKGSISGTLVMSDNMQMPPDIGVFLHFVTDKSENNFKLDTSVLESDVDSKGKFGFEELPFGSYHIYAVAKGHVGHAPAKLTKERPSSKHSISIVLADTIQGTVLNDEGAPIPEASVFAVSWRQGGGEQAMDMTRSRSSQTLTDETGVFTIGYVQVRPSAIDYKLMASAPGYANTVTPFLTVGSDNVEITLRPGQELTGIVIDAKTKEPVPNIKVSQDGTKVLNQVSDSTDMKGRFTLANITPGSHQLSIEHKSYILTEGTPAVKVLEDAPTDPVTLEVITGGIVVGRAIEIESNEGVPGARIQLGSRDNRAKRINKDVTTDANGHFRMEGLPTGSYQIRQNDVRGFARTTPPESLFNNNGQTQVIQVTASDAPANVILYYTKGIQIIGKVVDVENKPIDGVSVSGYSTERNENGGRTQNSDRTDEKGLFVLSGFKPNQTIQIQANKSSFSGTQLEPINLQSSTVTDYSITLRQGASVEGLIRDRNGNPMPSGVVEFSQNESRRHRANLDGQGNFKIQGVKSGTYKILFAAARNSNEKRKLLDTVSLGEGQQLAGLQYQVDIDASRTISGTITNARGEPVQASISARSRDHGTNATADESGHYELIGLLDGDYQLSVSHAEYTRQSRKGIKTPSVGINFTLQGRATISGTVTDASTGEPIPAFELVLVASTKRYTFGSSTGQYKTFNDSDGQFNYANIETDSNSRKLFVNAKGYSHTEYEVGVIYPDQELPNVRLTLVPGATVEGTVIDATGMPLAGAKVGPGNSSIAQRNDSFVVYTDKNGHYEMTSIPQGPLTLMAYKSNLDIAKKTVSISGSGSHRLDFQLLSGATLEGYVTLAGNPQPNLQVGLEYMSQTAQGMNKQARTNQDGFYRFVNTPSGQAQLRTGVAQVISSGKRTNRNIQHVIQIPAAQTLQFDIAVKEATASMTGNVLDENGDPVNRVRVSMNFQSEYGFESFSATSDANGHYVFESLPAGQYNATIRHNTYRFGQSIELKEEEKKEHDFKFNAGSTLVGTLVKPPSSTQQWVLLLLNQNATVREPLDIEFFSTIQTQTISQAEGGTQQLSMTNIQPGTFKLMAVILDQEFETIEEILANMRYTIQQITINENEVIEMKFDLD